MTLWEIATWASIAVLVGGSVAVFCWFALDVRRWFRTHPSRRARGEDE